MIRSISKYLSNQFSCIFNPRAQSDNALPDEQKSYHIISTLELRDYLKEIQESEDLNIFLDSIPHGSNYWITFLPQCNKNHSFTRYQMFPMMPMFLIPETHYCDCAGYLGQLSHLTKNGSFHPSKTTFRKHIGIHNLDHTCKLALSDYQAEKLKKLKKKREDLDNGKIDEYQSKI